jgi:6-phosphogluconolactonase (cycloisomerase 2 family)
VRAYQINRATGAVSALPNGVFSANGKTTSAVATHPTSPFLFAANRNSDNVAAFQIGADGRLTSLGTAAVPAASQPLAMAVDPSGHFLYVANWGGSTISGFSISASGTLTPLPGSPLAIGVKPSEIAVDPLGRFVYTMTNAFTSALGVFRINANGSLTPVSGGSPAGIFSVAGLPESLAVNANGRFVYIGSDLASAVAVFAIDPNTGVPTEIAGSPFSAGGVASSVNAIGLK